MSLVFILAMVRISYLANPFFGFSSIGPLWKTAASGGPRHQRRLKVRLIEESRTSVFEEPTMTLRHAWLADPQLFGGVSLAQALDVQLAKACCVGLAQFGEPLPQ
jgi:hypothetical protein